MNRIRQKFVHIHCNIHYYYIKKKKLYFIPYIRLQTGLCEVEKKKKKKVYHNYIYPLTSDDQVKPQYVQKEKLGFN